MNFTAPDTNVVIFRFLGGESDKKSAAENYFEKVSSGDFDGVIFHEVNNEYRKVVNREVSDIREFVNKAVDKGSWSAAESSLTVDTDFASNFLESLSKESLPLSVNIFKILESILSRFFIFRSPTIIPI